MAVMPVVYTALFLALCCWYVAVVRAMLNIPAPTCYRAWYRWRREILAAAALGIIVTAVAASRLYFCHFYPPGFYEDEIKDMHFARAAFNGDVSPFIASGGSGLPLLWYAITEGPLHYVVPTWWTIRLMPIVCGVLSVIGAYGVVRALGRGALAGLFAAACLGALPWAIAYGLTSMGGELIWHELIVLWVLALCVSDAALSPFVLVSGMLALTLLVYDYFAGKAVAWMLLPLLPALTRRWWVVVLLLAGTAVLCVPMYLAHNPYMWVGFLPGHIMGSASPPAETTVDVILPNLQYALHSFYRGPASTTGSMSLGYVLNTPLPLLLLAGAGWLVASWQVKWLLAVVFVVGLTPGVLTRHVTSHHIMMAAVAIPLAAACAIDKPWVLAVLLAGWLTVISMQQIMDPAMWQQTNWSTQLPEAER